MRCRRESRVVFVDWYRTLSDDPYWASIRDDPGHPPAVSLGVALQELFRTGSVELDAWMRGEMSATEIAAMLDVPGISHADLVALLRSDCVEMRLHPGLTDLLAELGREVMLVVATDNLDAFAAAFADALAGRGSRTSYTLGACAAMFDELICPSDVGARKCGWRQILRILAAAPRPRLRGSCPGRRRAPQRGGVHATRRQRVRWSGDASLPQVASVIRSWLPDRGD